MAPSRGISQNPGGQGCHSKGLRGEARDFSQKEHKKSKWSQVRVREILRGCNEKSHSETGLPKEAEKSPSLETFRTYWTGGWATSSRYRGSPALSEGLDQMTS